MPPKNRKPRRTGAGLRGVRRKLRTAFRLAEPRVRLALRHHRNTRGRPMTFRRRPYLLPIYLDRSTERVFKKSVQCGISEFLIIDAFESAARGLACLYVMPTQEKRDKFVANRVTRAINVSAHYRWLVRSGPGKANSSRMKHLGDGVISFVGSNAENEFVEFPADLVIVDEVDRCNLNNLPLARDRLAASPHKLIAYASTPTYAEVGIARLYDESDAREWHVRCDHCGRRQPLDFFTNVVRQTGTDEYELLDREWAGTNHDDTTTRRGKQISNHKQQIANKHQEPNSKSETAGGATPHEPSAPTDDHDGTTTRRGKQVSNPRQQIANRHQEPNSKSETAGGAAPYEPSAPTDDHDGTTTRRGKQISSPEQQITNKYQAPNSKSQTAGGAAPHEPSAPTDGHDGTTTRRGKQISNHKQQIANKHQEPNS
ncbi:MAG: phage terminase large subunit family protein, partial [Planctomycetota bacterium]